jgi:serine O-acetyltransferase
VIRLILSDLRAKALWCYEDGSARGLLKALATDGTSAMLFYRMMQWSRAHRLVPLELLFNKIIVIACGCVIGRGAEFGPGFVLVHSLGIVINGRVRGGSHVYLEHQVTIGAERDETPTLGDHVYVGAGAKVLASVGSHCRIGANAVVLQPVPDHSTAVGIPARVVRKGSDQSAPADELST